MWEIKKKNRGHYEGSNLGRTHRSVSQREKVSRRDSRIVSSYTIVIDFGKD